VTEVIAAAGALVHQKATAHEVAEIVFAHPTISESLKEAVEDTLDMCLHAPPKKMVRVAVGA
jgi:dihydrolipoamide dehydrogenase